MNLRALQVVTASIGRKPWGRIELHLQVQKLTPPKIPATTRFPPRGRPGCGDIAVRAIVQRATR